MMRKLSSFIFALASLSSSAALAQSPPLCPQGTWPSKTGSGWVCSRSETTSDSSSSTDKPQKKGGRGGGGMGGGMDGIGGGGMPH